MVKNTLWTLRDVIPRVLIHADILHTMRVGNLQHWMKWIKGFLDHNNRLPAFNNIWSSLAPYAGNHVPRKVYRLLTQLSGKEMRSIVMVILGIFTATQYRKTGTQCPTASQDLDFKRVITCVRYLRDLALRTRYRSHTDRTRGYMQEYLPQFHATKDVS